MSIFYKTAKGGLGLTVTSGRCKSLARYTNDIVYERIAPGVLAELQAP